MDGGRRYSIQSPFVSNLPPARSNLPPPLTTRGRCIKFAKDEGYGSLTEVNLFAYRAPDKSASKKAVTDEKVDAVGPEDDRLMRDAVMGADMVVVAWGIQTAIVCSVSGPRG